MDTNKLFQLPPEMRAMEAVKRFSAIKRWHMVDTTKTQTLAEHSANVALLVYLISTTSPQMYFGPSSGVMLPALIHDLEEVFTGDLPALTKPFLRGVSELEEAVLPMEFRRNPPSDDLATLIKLCDLADGIRFIELYGIGNTARWASTGLRQQMDARLAPVRHLWPAVVYQHVHDMLEQYVGERS